MSVQREKSKTSAWLYGLFVAYLMLVFSGEITYVMEYASTHGYAHALTLDDLRNSSGIPFDVLRYNRQAFMLSEDIKDPSLAISNVFLLNWTGLAYIGALLRQVFGEWFLSIASIVNAFFLFCSWRNYRSLFPRYISTTAELSILAFSVPPFVGAYLYGLNKECISLYAISAITRSASSARLPSVSTVALLALSRTHLLGCLAAFIPTRRRLFLLAIFLLGTGLAYPYLHLTNNIDQYYASQAGEVRTQALYRALESIKNVPGGYVITFPVLVAINAAAPLFTSISKLGQGAGNIYVYYLSFGIQLPIALGLWLWPRRPLRGDLPLFIFLVIVLTTPFLQPRYLLPIMPAMFALGLIARRARVTVPTGGREAHEGKVAAPAVGEGVCP